MNIRSDSCLNPWVLCDLLGSDSIGLICGQHQCHEIFCVPTYIREASLGKGVPALYNIAFRCSFIGTNERYNA